jgi:hypothetical protein
MHPPCGPRSFSMELAHFARPFGPSRPTHALPLSPSFSRNEAAVHHRFRAAPPVALPMCHRGGIRAIAPWPSLPLDWSQPLLHFISPLNIETIGHRRPPLYSAPPPQLTAPTYKMRREHPLPPPHPIYHRRLFFPIADPSSSPPQPLKTSVRIAGAPSPFWWSHNELWSYIAPPGKLSGEPRSRPCPRYTVDHGTAQSTDPWTQSTDFSIGKIFHFLVYSEKPTLRPSC